MKQEKLVFCKNKLSGIMKTLLLKIGDPNGCIQNHFLAKMKNLRRTTLYFTTALFFMTFGGLTKDIAWSQTSTPTILASLSSVEPPAIHGNATKVYPALTPFSSMTKEQYEDYLKTQRENDNFDSASRQGLKEEKEDIKNHKIQVHPYHPHHKPWIIPKSPSNLKIEPRDGAVHLAWDTMPMANDYCVYISEDGKKFKERMFGTNDKTEVTIGILKNGMTYYFGVTSIVKNGGESEKTILKITLPNKY